MKIECESCNNKTNFKLVKVNQVNTEENFLFECQECLSLVVTTKFRPPIADESGNLRY